MCRFSHGCLCGASQTVLMAMRFSLITPLRKLSAMLTLMHKHIKIMGLIVFFVSLFFSLYMTDIFGLKSIMGIIQAACTDIIPLLFWIAAFGQDKLDREAGNN